jgi:signal transduction histidine kinase
MVTRSLNRLPRCRGDEQRQNELATLTRISDEVLSSDTLQSACRRIAEEISASTGFAGVLIERYDAARDVMLIEAATGPVREVPREQPAPHSLSGTVVVTGQPLVVPGVAEDPVLACIPMLAGSETIGALTLVDHASESDLADRMPWLRSVANFAGVLIALKRSEHERLERRDQILSVAAHELLTPVAALRASSQLLARKVDRLGLTNERQDLREGIALVAEQTDKLTRLVSQLMDMARLDAGKVYIYRSQADVAVCVRSAVAAMQSLAPERRIVLEGPSSLLASVDALRIEQVLGNLLSNAVRYSPPDRPIEVQLGYDETGGVRLSVRDHGPGIPAEHRERIYERFYQVDRPHAFGGMGLGLYISAEIVGQHGGRLVHESPPDGGTRFVVVLPPLLG